MQRETLPYEQMARLDFAMWIWSWYVVWYGIPSARRWKDDKNYTGRGQGHDFRPLATAAARSATKSAAWSPGGRARTNVPTKMGT